MTCVASADQTITLPNQKDSLHFAIIGDSGSGSSSQYKIAERMVAARAAFPFDIVLMMGDNLYMGSAPSVSRSVLHRSSLSQKQKRPLIRLIVLMYSSSAPCFDY